MRPPSRHNRLQPGHPLAAPSHAISGLYGIPFVTWLNGTWLYGNPLITGLYGNPLMTGLNGNQFVKTEGKAIRLFVHKTKFRYVTDGTTEGPPKDHR